MLFVLLGAIPDASATRPNPEHKVTLCHRTDSYTNPYVVITVDIASVKFAGHNGHNGPVFSPSLPKHTKWGDIIPPFDYGPGRKYAGKNWTQEGMAIFANQCRASSPTTTTTPGSTTPASTTPESTTPGSTTPGSTTPGSSAPESTTTTSVSPDSTTTTLPETIPTVVPNESTTSSTIEATVEQGATTSTSVSPSSASQGPLPTTGTAALGLVLLGLASAATGVVLLRQRTIREI